MRRKSEALVLVLAFVLTLFSGCAHLGQEVKTTPREVIITLQRAVDAFEQGDLQECQNLLEGALKEIPRYNYEIRRKVLIALGFTYLYNNNVKELGQVSKELRKISRQLGDNNAEKDPQEAIIQAIVAVNSGKPNVAKKILSRNYKLYATGVERLLVREEVK